jgi:hypothetical protein
MPIYSTTFDIAAAERVWTVLTDLSRYGEWNPQIPRATGTLEPGGTIEIRLVLPARPAMNLSATIEEAEPNSLLSWRGNVVAPWFFEGYRQFVIRPVAADRVSFTHLEDIHGLFAPVFSLLMGAPVQKSHHALNQALRARAEGSQ